MRKRPYSPEELEIKRAKNRIYERARYKRKRDEILAKNRKYREVNKEMLKAKWHEYNKKYVLTHPERVKASKTRWYKNNPVAHGRWAKENPKRANEIKAAYKKRNPITKLQDVLRNRVVMALKSQGLKKNKRTVEMIGCSIEELKAHLESRFAVGMAWENRGYWGWHVDHIKPLSLFDLTDEAQQKLAFHYSNLQPLWAKDNFSKKNKYAI